MIHIDLDETLPQIRGDHMKLTQLVDDLVANALKYSPSGGEILLKSRREDIVIQISIQDHGIGIPSHALETIFDAFSHIYVDKTQYVPGVGLGLPIVKQIVHLHGGHIWVESTLGEGSCFRITLPIVDDTVVVHHEAV
jgi:two-component system sensor histidine kinase VicK